MDDCDVAVAGVVRTKADAEVAAAFVRDMDFMRKRKADWRKQAEADLRMFGVLFDAVERRLWKKWSKERDSGWIKSVKVIKCGSAKDKSDEPL